MSAAWENEFYELIKTIVQMVISGWLKACVEDFWPLEILTL